MATKITYEKWGNNEWHDPSLCETCENCTCAVCSNGPRGSDYDMAIAEEKLNNMMRASISFSGLDDF